MQALQFSWILYMLVIGAVLSIAAYLALRLPRQRPDAQTLEEFAADISAENGRIPPVLWALYIGIACALLGYVLYVWLAAPNF